MDFTPTRKTSVAKRKRTNATPSAGVEEHANRCHKQLLATPERLSWLEEHRGITASTIERCSIGWESGSKRYTFPIRDTEGVVVNVRHHRTGTSGAKVLPFEDCGKPVRLYAPFGFTDQERVLLVEGEYDAVIASQALDAIGADVMVVTGTGGALSPPCATELEPLRDCQVFIAYDCDKAGANGANKTAAALEGIARDVHVVQLGLGDREDIGDWFVTYDHSAGELLDLLDEVEQGGTALEIPAEDRRPVEDLLELAALKVPELGSRNQAGLWLACQLRDEGYPEAECEAPMLEFAASVTDLKPEPYTEQEARTSLASAFSRPGRLAIGKTGAGYSTDDIGNAERLVDAHGTDMRFVRGEGWFVWDGRRWIPDDTGHLERWAKESVRGMRREALTVLNPELKKALLSHAKTSSAAHKVRAAIQMAESEPGVTVPASQFDSSERLFVVRNGVLELGTEGAVLREHRREDYSKLMTDVVFDPTAKAPVWDRFLRDAMPDADVRRHVQKLVGYSLLGGNPERRLVLVMGPTGAGKTTFGETMKRVLGEYAGSFNLSIFRGKKEEAGRPDLMAAINKRFLFTAEAESEWELHSDQVKRMVGHDAITARPLYSNKIVSKVPDFTPWISTNNPPQISRPDLALTNRLVAVPFGQASRPRAAQDLALASKLAAEVAGILAWAIQGWDLYVQEGLGTVPPEVARETRKLRRSLSDVDDWIGDCAVRDAKASTAFISLWESYRNWCVEVELPPAKRLSRNAFAKALDDRAFEKVRVRVGDRMDDHKEWQRKGLRLRIEGRIRIGEQP